MMFGYFRERLRESSLLGVERLTFYYYLHVVKVMMKGEELKLSKLTHIFVWPTSVSLKGLIHREITWSSKSSDFGIFSCKITV